MEKEIVILHLGENMNIEEKGIARKHHGGKGRAAAKVAALHRIVVATGIIQGEIRTTETTEDGVKVHLTSA